MSMQRFDNHLAVFERDGGCCRYCNEDLLWTYSIFASTRFDRIPATTDEWATCCEACYRQLKECSYSSFDERREFVQQQTRVEIEQYRAIAQKIRFYGRGDSILARLVQAGVLRNGDVISLDKMLPSFLRHSRGNAAYQAIVHCVPGLRHEVIYMADEELHDFGDLTFEIFQRGHLLAPYRKTQFSWSVCPYDHWVTEANVSLSELRVRLDWDDLPSDGDLKRSPDDNETLVGEDDPYFEIAKAVLPHDQVLPVSFLQRRFRISYSRACRLYWALGSLRYDSRRRP